MTKYNCKDMPIEELSINVRIYNSLRRANILTIGDLLERLYHGRPTINLIRNLGETGLHNILEKLEDMDCLPDDLPLDIDVRTQDKRIQWLIDSQLENGSWYDDIDTTIAALLSVIRSDHVFKDVDLQLSIGWVEQRTSQISDEVLIYAWQRIQAESASISVPDCPFDLRFTENQYYGNHDAKNLDELRRVALIRGNAIKKDPYYDAYRPEGKLGLTYTRAEIMWMTVGEPKSEK